jgi:hypothetical protein
LLGPRSIEDFENNLTSIDLELGAIRILNGGIIALDPLIVDELGSQTTFTHAACSQYYHMEFATRLIVIMSWHDGG